MKLICCGTGSTGNTYILKGKKECLILDAGVPFKETKIALNFNVRGIQGVLVTHAHNDHNGFSHEYEAAGIPVWRPYENESLRQDGQFGGFRIQSFGVIHNVPCCGFLIEHKDLGKMLYVTDSSYIPYRFHVISTILIEANWGEKYVHKDEPKYMHSLQHHMSIETCVEAIRVNASYALDHVILCHLSDNNSDEGAFRRAVEAIVPAGCTVDVAAKGLVVDLSDIPF